MNTPVSFELAKLLKEKGLNLPCSDYYTQRGGLMSDGWGDIIYEQGFGSGEPDRMLKFDYSDFNKHQKETCFLCPIIVDVIMWLYEKHSLWIIILPTVTGHFAYKIIDVQLNPERLIERPSYKDVSAEHYNSPTEAYTASIEYTLNNLI